MSAGLSLTDQDVRDITEAVEWALGFYNRLISAARESTDFLAELDDLLLELKNGLRAESPNTHSQTQNVLDGVPAGGLLQMRDAVAHLAAYDRLLGEVHTPDLAESREIGDVVAAEVGHHKAPYVARAVTRYVAGAVLMPFRWLQRRAGLRRAAATAPRPSDPITGPGSGELPGPGTTVGGVW